MGLSGPWFQWPFCAQFSRGNPDKELKPGQYADAGDSREKRKKKKHQTILMEKRIGGGFIKIKVIERWGILWLRTDLDSKESGKW